MKLGLHAYALHLAGGLREFQPVGRGKLSAKDLLDKAAQLKLNAVQLARDNVSTDPVSQWDMVMLVNLRRQAEELDLALHLSTNTLDGEHLTELIRAAYTLGAKQVTTGLSHLQGNVQQRQKTLEQVLRDLDKAIKTAERYNMVLTIENGRHTAATDLAALIQAAQSEHVWACFDMGNALTVPESPLDAAEILAPYCRSVHMKDLQAYRTAEGAMLINCPVGDGVVNITDVLQVLNAKSPKTDALDPKSRYELYVFLQTAVERIHVPVLDDDFLQRYPRITARALAGLMRQGALAYPEADLVFPHERKSTEREILKFEDDRLKRSVKAAQKLIGTESLTLVLD